MAIASSFEVASFVVVSASSFVVAVSASSSTAMLAFIDAVTLLPSVAVTLPSVAIVATSTLVAYLEQP